MGRARRALLAGAVSLGMWCSAWAQTPPDGLPGTVEDALRTMAQAAGVIFTGTVTAVRRPPAGGVIEVEFAVTDSIRGVNGGSYVLREWPGLWTGGDAPFRVGQRYLMLLHTPNAAGLSSPVFGGDGAVPLRGSGAAASDEASAQNASASAAGMPASASAASSPGGEVADLGWVATHMVMPLAYLPAAPRRGPATGPAAGPIRTHAEMSDSRAADSGSDAAAVAGANRTGLPQGVDPAVRATPYGSVVTLLRRWQEAGDATR